MTLALAVDDPLAIGAVEAIQRGDGQRLRSLLDTHPELAAARIGESAPDRGAVHGGQRAIAELLLAAGADPNGVGWDGLTPCRSAPLGALRSSLNRLGSLGPARG